MEALISTAEAARLAGVGTTSVKRWADEGLLPCQKTAGGHRRFVRYEVERFLRELSPDALFSSSQSWLELLTFANTPKLHAALLEARGRLGAWYRVCDELGPVFSRLGEQWACGNVSVLQEHVASERIRRAMSFVSEGLPVPMPSPTCLLACAEGDEHTLGLSLAELCLREAGWSTLWAGRRTPATDIAEAVVQGEVEMVALSASIASPDCAVLERQLAVIGEACQRHRVPLVLGGSGAWPEHSAPNHRFTAFQPFAHWLEQERE
ncbi:MAG TPA: cobalamin-dependent protein [Polyangiaceae bacterium]|nr:cobalamin-dependent protein [Polyangiaceae bacterium]